MRKSKLLLFVIIALASIFTLTACGGTATKRQSPSGDSIGSVDKNKSLGNSFEFVTEDAQPPVQYAVSGEVKGIAFDVLKEAFKKMGYSVTAKAYPWSRALDMCKNGEADGVFSAYYKDERAQYGIYSKEFLVEEKTTFYVLKDSNVKYDGKLENLSGIKIALPRGYSGGEAFDKMVKAGSLKVEYGNTAESCIDMLLNNRGIDVILNSKYTVLDILKKKGKLDAVKELTPALDNAPSFLVFSKKKNIDPAIIDKFDKTLAEMKKDGSYQKIIDSYTK